MVFGLGLRRRVHMRSTLENGVLCNRLQLASAVNSFIDQVEFVAVKMLSGHRAPCLHFSNHNEQISSYAVLGEISFH